MKTYVRFFITMMFGCLLIGCVPNDSIEDLLDNEEKILLHTEQAYPGVMGETVQLDIGGETITCQKINDEYIFQGDILLQSPTKGAAFAEGSLWPDNTVYYSINPNLPNPGRVHQAIEYYESNTNLTFVARTTQHNYIEFIYDKNGCSSYLGMIGGKQPIRLADWGTKGTVIHEIGHAIGLLHEHSKAGRDQYVTILENNVLPGKLHNFKEYTSSYPNTAGFDFESIMLYSSYAFSRNNHPTIVKKDGEPFTSQRVRMSEDDINIVNLLYPDKAGYTREQLAVLETLSGIYESNDMGDDDEDMSFGFDFSEKYNSPVEILLDVYGQSQQSVTVHGKGQISYTLFFKHVLVCSDFYFQIREDGKHLTIYVKDIEEDGYVGMSFLLADVLPNEFKIYVLDDFDPKWITFTKINNPHGLTEDQVRALEVLEGTFFLDEGSIFADEGSITFVRNDPPQILEENIAEGTKVKIISHGKMEVLNVYDGGSDYFKLHYYIWKDGSGITMFSDFDDTSIIEVYLKILSPNFIKIGFMEGNGILWAALTKGQSTTFTDSRDGNVYKTVTIGNQVWMAENLAYLPRVTGPEVRSNTTAYYYVYDYYGSNVSAAKATENYNTYGVLYNWPAARTACPAGWHLPNDAEWTQLTNFLGGNEIAGGKMKETGTAHWKSPNTGATNESGFSALPGGYPYENGTFGSYLYVGDWWSSTEFDTTAALQRSLHYNSSSVFRYYNFKQSGYSVRCIKD
ncbi:MAG: hypothetical protein GX877_04730 [Bacteroidales bacterium]|nr:hypothetical protein [Bacteroidales bacterium]